MSTIVESALELLSRGISVAHEAGEEFLGPSERLLWQRALKSAPAEALGLSVPPPEERAPHMLGIGLPREAAARVAAALGESGVIASVRGLSVRIAPHLHVNESDVDRLLDALARALGKRST